MIIGRIISMFLRLLRRLIILRIMMLRILRRTIRLLCLLYLLF